MDVPGVLSCSQSPWMAPVSTHVPRVHISEVAFVLDPEYAAVAYLRPFQTNELAKSGDADVTQLLVEYTLEVKNQAAHAIIADLAE